MDLRKGNKKIGYDRNANYLKEFQELFEFLYYLFKRKKLKEEEFLFCEMTRKNIFYVDMK